MPASGRSPPAAEPRARISAAESQVMQLLWERGPLGADELKLELGAAQGWGEATVKTLINRLLKKRALESRRAGGPGTGGRTTYHPLLTRETWVTAESRGLLDRLFDGQLAPLVAHFARQRELSPEDVARLRRLIATLDEED